MFRLSKHEVICSYFIPTSEFNENVLIFTRWHWWQCLPLHTRCCHILNTHTPSHCSMLPPCEYSTNNISSPPGTCIMHLPLNKSLIHWYFTNSNTNNYHLLLTSKYHTGTCPTTKNCNIYKPQQYSTGKMTIVKYTKWNPANTLYRVADLQGSH